MEQSTLQEILGVEKSLREELDAERRKSSEWLDDARREIERDHLERLEAIRREANQAEEQVRQGAASAVSAAIGSGTGLDAQQALPDEELRRRVRPHLAALVPGPTRAR